MCFLDASVSSSGRHSGTKVCRKGQNKAQTVEKNGGHKRRSQAAVASGDRNWQSQAAVRRKQRSQAAVKSGGQKRRSQAAASDKRRPPAAATSRDQ
jgi:hypothetical protein